MRLKKVLEQVEGRELRVLFHRHLFVGGLKDMLLVRLVLDQGKVVGEEHLLKDRGHRIRDVRQGPDGALYYADFDGGTIRRIASSANLPPIASATGSPTR